MFHIFFSVNYWITRYVFRNREYPLFSTITIVTAYQFFTLLFFYKLVFFHIYHRRDLVMDESKIVGYSVMTIILLLNLYYFKLKKAEKIINNFNKLKVKEKFIFKLISIIVMILIIVLTILMAYSIKNNIYWF